MEMNNKEKLILFFYFFCSCILTALAFCFWVNTDLERILVFVLGGIVGVSILGQLYNVK
jgi:hypothetical protein